MQISIFDYKIIKPFEIFGLTSNFLIVHIDTIIYSWIAMLILLVLSLIGKYSLKRKNSLFMVAFENIIDFFVNIFEESFDKFNFNYFSFVVSIFFFTLFCCLVGLIPFLDESTKDLNTTFALGLTSFCYVQYHKIKVHGMVMYLKEFLHPFFLLAPINIVGELAKVASMSFRLFGNILGGGVILTMMIEFVGIYKASFVLYAGIILLLSLILKKTNTIQSKILNKLVDLGVATLFLLCWAQIFFGIFEGIIQSFVITMLTITYLSMGIKKDNGSLKEKSS
jgi:F-type H+-transporting ATPase subunit a